MITAKFGTKAFEVKSDKIYTPDGLTYTDSINYEETEVSGKKKTLNIKGLNLKDLSFDVKLDSRFVNVESEIKFWDDKMLSKKSENFSLGNTTLGRFFITQVSKKEINIAKNGRYSKATITLTFKEDGESANSVLFPEPPKKVQNVKNSSSSSSKKIKKGTKIKPKNGVRWYYTGEGAIKRTGKSGKAYNKVMSVTYIYKDGKAINPGGLGWLIPSDVDVVS